ncbi:triose-phosphate isomerase [Marinospirillum alkaliphilum]|uniref:Triosephosphate isomerase n=1 Tax=Marinospirillum alkaliphilum DSM 21637 TaxID=1122209 RepID=A0A1K1Y7E2_9GAMM|nr:triose-phosphate isomerase [Marinospirillum alkaliphilum]SFX57253.1 triosephosphate isomerase [Marinospirillum alkaliphilum DSM 21637]
MRQKLVAGNWKMHGSREMTDALLKQLLAARLPTAAMLVCPPFPYLQQAASSLQGSGVLLGAQDCAANESGAYTGEVAATMLADLGVSHVLLGHSERRQYQQETDALVLQKAQQALAAGLKPVICVGETLAEREAGQTEQVVLRQAQAILQGLTAQQLQQVIFAYEPVWAIGTGLTATPQQAQDVHALLRSAVAEVSPQLAETMLLLYGGSVKPDNAASLFAMTDIDGGLIGGASLDADQFLAIGYAAE